MRYKVFGFLLIFLMTPVPPARAEKPVHIKTLTFQRELECPPFDFTPEKKTGSVYISAPTDDTYKFLGVHVDTILNDVSPNSYSTTYEPEYKRVRIDWVVLRDPSLWSFGWNHCNTAHLNLRVTAQFEKGSFDVDPEIVCGAVPPAPEESKVGAMIRLQEKRLAVIQCRASLARKVRDAHLGSQEIIENFTEELLQRGEELKGKEFSKLVAQSALAWDFQVQTRKMRESFEPVEAESKRLFDSFTTAYGLKARQHNELLLQLNKEAQGATLEGSAALQAKVMDLINQESELDNTYVLQGRRLLGDIVVLEDSYRNTLLRFGDFMRENYLPVADPGTRLKQALSKMIAVCSQRSTEFNSKAQGLFEGIQARGSSLIASQADLKTRETIANAGELEAASRFMHEMNAQIIALSTPARRSPRYALPFLEEQYLRRRRFLGLAETCTASGFKSNAWLRPGCVALQLHVRQAHYWMDLTFPKAIHALVESLAVDVTVSAEIKRELPAIEELLRSGRPLEAARSHDRVLFEAGRQP